MKGEITNLFTSICKTSENPTDKLHTRSNPSLVIYGWGEPRAAAFAAFETSTRVKHMPH